MQSIHKTLLSVNEEFLVSEAPAGPLLHAMRQKDVLTSLDWEQIRCLEGQGPRAVKRFVVNVLPKRGPLAFPIFLEALQEARAQHLVDLLLEEERVLSAACKPIELPKREPPKPLPDPNEYARRLQANRHLIEEAVDPSHVAPTLAQNGILSGLEKQLLGHVTGQPALTWTVLWGVLMQRGQRAYSAFMAALLQHGYSALFHTIEETKVGKSSSVLVRTESSSPPLINVRESRKVDIVGKGDDRRWRRISLPAIQPGQTEDGDDQAKSGDILNLKTGLKSENADVRDGSPGLSSTEKENPSTSRFLEGDSTLRPSSTEIADNPREPAGGATDTLPDERSVRKNQADTRDQNDASKTHRNGSGEVQSGVHTPEVHKNRDETGDNTELRDSRNRRLSTDSSNRDSTRRLSTYSTNRESNRKLRVQETDNSHGDGQRRNRDHDTTSSASRKGSSDHEAPQPSSDHAAPHHEQKPQEHPHQHRTESRASNKSPAPAKQSRPDAELTRTDLISGPLAAGLEFAPDIDKRLTSSPIAHSDAKHGAAGRANRAESARVRKGSATRQASTDDKSGRQERDKTPAQESDAKRDAAKSARGRRSGSIKTPKK